MPDDGPGRADGAGALARLCPVPRRCCGAAMISAGSRQTSRSVADSRGIIASTLSMTPSTALRGSDAAERTNQPSRDRGGFHVAAAASAPRTNGRRARAVTGAPRLALHPPHQNLQDTPSAGIPPSSPRREREREMPGAVPAVLALSAVRLPRPARAARSWKDALLIDVGAALESECLALSLFTFFFQSGMRRCPETQPGARRRSPLGTSASCARGAGTAPRAHRALDGAKGPWRRPWRRAGRQALRADPLIFCCLPRPSHFA